MSNINILKNIYKCYKLYDDRLINKIIDLEELPDQFYDKPFGLPNIGNTCYSASVYQILLNNEAFVKFICYRGDYDKTKNNNNITNLIKQYKEAYEKKNNRFFIRSQHYKELFTKKSFEKDCFINYEQEDAVDYFDKLIDILSFKREDNYFIDKIQFMQIQTNTDNNPFKIFFLLFDEIPINDSKSYSINELYKNYFDNITYRVYNINDYLFIAIGRLITTTSSRNNLKINIDEKIQIDGNELELLGFNHHLPGHYIAYVKKYKQDKSSYQWYECDDAHINLKNDAEMKVIFKDNKNVYLLMYKKIKP